MWIGSLKRRMPEMVNKTGEINPIVVDEICSELDFLLRVPREEIVIPSKGLGTFPQDRDSRQRELADKDQ